MKAFTFIYLHLPPVGLRNVKQRTSTGQMKRIFEKVHKTRITEKIKKGSLYTDRPH